MEPLKFEANITGNAIQQLDNIKAKLESIKSVDINLTIHQATGLENLVDLISEVKEAIKGGRFGEFATKINKCAEAMTNLNEAFVKFNGTIGQDESLKNFMVGVGEVLKNVKVTMTQLEGAKLGLNTQETDVYARNAEKLQDALYRIQEARAKVGIAIKDGEGIGMNVSGMKIYLTMLDLYEKKLQNIRSNPFMMQETNWQVHELGTTFRHLISNAGDFQKAVDQERKAFNESQRMIREEIDRTISKMRELDAAINRGTNAGRDMTALSDARSRLAGNLRILEHMTPADKKDTDLVERRVNEVRKLRDETEELRKAENKLTIERERANKAQQKADTKALNEEIKSVNDARVKYNELAAQIKEIEALKERGLRANIDVSQADLAIEKLKLIKEMLNEIAINDGRTNAMPAWGGRNVLTKDLLASEGAKGAALQSKTALAEYKESLADVEKRMNTASKTADNLGKHLDRLQAKKVDFNGLDTAKLDAAMLRIREIQNELMRFASTGQSAFGNTANEIVRAMGLASANKEAADATAQLNKQLKEGGTAAQGAASATAQLTEQEKLLAQALKQANTESKDQSHLLNDLRMLATQYLSVWGAQQFLNNIIQIGGQLESQRLSLTAILGQRSYANDLFSKIQSMAVKSPFGVVQLDQYSKNLSAFGFQYNELFDMTKRLADIAAGTGTDFGRLALAIGHVRNEMALTGYTLRQFAMANVPMLKKLSENLGVTTEQVRKLVRAKEVSYQDVEKVLKDLTDEGGMFYNMQEVMSEAVSARFKNLKDSMDIMYGQMAESKLGGILKATATGLMEVTKRWQAFGTAILAAAGGMGLYKLSQLATNAAIRAMTTEVTMSKVALAGKNAEEIKAMAISGKWSAETLVRLVLTKQLTVEQAELAAAELGVDAAMLKNIGTMKMAKGAMLELGGASMAAMLTNPWFLLTAAISATLGILMEYKQWSDGIINDVKTYVDTLRTAQERIGMYLSQAKEAGRPANDRDYVGEIEQMKTLLKDSGLFSKEIERQADLTEDLNQEYDYLLNTLKETDKVMISISANAEKIGESIKASSTTGDGWNIGAAFLEAGSGIFGAQAFLVELLMKGGKFKDTNIGKTWDFFFNDDINKNAQQLSDSAGAYERRLNRLEAYKDKMKEVADSLKVGANLALEDQILLLAQDSDKWEEFVRRTTEGSGALASDLRKDLDEVFDLAGDVSDNWEGILTDDIPRMLEQMADQFHGNEEALKEDMRANKTYYQQYLDAMLEKVKSISPQMKDELRDMMWDWVNGPKKISEFFNPGGILNNLIGKRIQKSKELLAKEAAENEQIVEAAGRKAIGSIALQDLPSLQKLNSSITAAWLSKYIKHETDASEIEDDVVKKWQEYTAKAAADEKMGRKEQQKADEEEASKLKAVIDYYKFEDKKKTGSGSGSGSSYKDEYAKRWDERIRIMKEAYDWYDKWEKKVSEDSAFAKVQEKYGDIFKEWETDHLIPLKFNAEDIKDFEKYVREYTQAAAKQYNMQKNDKSKNYGEQALRVLRYGTGVLTDMGFDRFSKKSEEFTSSMKRDVDELTRKWNTFMSVISSTGNASLAGRLSGLNKSHANFKTTAADIKAIGLQMAIERSIDFNAVLRMSDKEIEQYAKTIGIAEDKIAGLIEGLKDWKKEQQDVTKSDLENYARYLGSLMDVESQLTRIRGEYNKELEETNRLLLNGEITQDEAFKRESNAMARRASKEWGLTAAYSNLYNNSLGMARGDFAESYAKEMTNLDSQLKTGVISLDDYAQKVGNLNKIAREFSESGFLGIRGGVGSFLSGGVQGLIGYYDRRSAAARREGNDEEAYRYKKMADSLSKQQKAAEQLTKALQDLSSMANQLGSMFDALGNEDVANAFNDVGGVLNGIAGGANSLSAFGPWGMGVGAAIGGITSLAQMHDNQLQRQIEAIQREIDALDANTEAIKTARERTLGYDFGNYRRNLAALWGNEIQSGDFGKSVRVLGRTYDYTSPAATAMQEFYSRNSAGSGYAQELRNLQEERKKYMDMYDAENEKKKKSQETLNQYKDKISELDDTIINFSEDVAKSLWAIDVKGWSDQINDALASAFENGESLMKAFDDTVKSIMQSVVHEISKIGIIEPMMQRLRDRLFGQINEKGEYTGGVVSTEEMLENPKVAAQKMLATVADYFKPGGEGSQMTLAMQEFMEGVNNYMEQLGFTNGIKATESANTLSASVQGIKEEQADILAGIVRSMWQDVATNRLMLTTFFEEQWAEYVETINNGIVAPISRIDTNIAAITALLAENGILHQYIRNMSTHMDELIYGNERLKVQ